MARKRQPYLYNINGTVVRSWRKVYLNSKGVYCHREGDFLVPVGPKLFMAISMAKLGGEPVQTPPSPPEPDGQT